MFDSVLPPFVWQDDSYMGHFYIVPHPPTLFSTICVNRGEHYQSGINDNKLGNRDEAFSSSESSPEMRSRTDSSHVSFIVPVDSSRDSVCSEPHEHLPSDPVLERAFSHDIESRVNSSICDSQEILNPPCPRFGETNLQESISFDDIRSLSRASRLISPVESREV